MTKVDVLKLKSGEIVVGEEVDCEDGSICLKNPMLMLIHSLASQSDPSVRHDRFILRPYAFLCEEQEIEFGPDDYLVVLTPKPDLVAAYLAELATASREVEAAMAAKIASAFAGDGAEKANSIPEPAMPTVMEAQTPRVSISISMPKEVFVELAEDGLLDALMDQVNYHAAGVDRDEDDLDDDDEDDDEEEGEEWKKGQQEDDEDQDQ